MKHTKTRGSKSRTRRRETAAAVDAARRSPLDQLAHLNKMGFAATRERERMALRQLMFDSIKEK